jgi:uncharacterized membrane protein
MDPIAHLALAAVAFLASHTASSTPFRGVLVKSLGERGFLGAYTLASFATLGWMIYAFVHAPFMPLWQTTALKHWPLVIMPFSLILLACGLVTRNPTAVLQERALQTAEPARGILRVTRHPLMWSIGLWAVVHLLARGDAASLIFFGAFALLALGGTRLIDMRKAKTLGENWKRFAEATSILPFLAIIQGRNHFKFAEIGWSKIALGLVLYCAVFWLHPHLFGVRPY